jgi:hypothetical protein
LAGCDAFLPKPIEIDKLLGLLAQHLKLDWIYAAPPEIERAGEAIEPAAPWVLPPPDELSIFLDLARRGHLRGIGERAARLKQQDQRYARFADKLRELAQGFKEKALLALLEQSAGQPL